MGRGNSWLVTLTGKSRPCPPGGGGSRNSDRTREYICPCGHVGWSRHIDLEAKEIRERANEFNQGEGAG